MTQKKFLHYFFIAILIFALFDGIVAQNDTSSGNSSDTSAGSSNQASDSGGGLDPKYITDPDSCPNEVFTNNDDKQKCCELLNKKRAKFADCCDYPQLVIWQWQYNLCVKQTSVGGKPPTRCNLLHCCFQYLGVLTSNVPKDGMNEAGFEYSFLLSVDNNTRWVGPIKESVTQCMRLAYVPPPTNLDKQSNDYKNYWDCYEQIPNCLYTIVDCSYDYNYYYCPEGVFKEDVPGCVLSKQFVHDCFIEGIVS
ncbi:hypothetical protein PVAND_017189 [Polypedilum vanderplanki]|uniref:Chitin-binding type-2 domain-containing protein n=1 Tax=Polypedilum vanderplanki TaxID=319348 RepID=A0A9J6BHL0_POLVA|nr:hypothetical protein PVAND_017189 [Polypedilum vanderplanki]